MAVRHWLRLSSLPDADRPFSDGQPLDLPVPVRKVSAPCQGLRPRGTDAALAITHRIVLPSATQKASASRTSFVTWLDTWPIASPVNASPQTSRSGTHDSGPMWLALPSS